MRSLKISALLIFTLTATSVFAQNSNSRFSFELNAGPSLATQDLGGTDLNIGLGFEGTIIYRFMPHLGAYAGWGWNKFASDEQFEGIDADFEETGYVFGLEFKHPIQTSDINWLIKAGGLYNHLEIENSDGDIVWDTGHGLGYQLVAGIELPVGEKWRLRPTIKYHSLSREIDVNGSNRDLDLRYLGARIGLVRNF
ncbi:MAG: outer membrane beta-barrel protein [Gracilimonas sp.]|nr:outer membrane beta-barrel protein [Gracilimonas sp.]